MPVSRTLQYLNAGRADRREMRRVAYVRRNRQRRRTRSHGCWRRCFRAASGRLSKLLEYTRIKHGTWITRINYRARIDHDGRIKHCRRAYAERRTLSERRCYRAQSRVPRRAYLRPTCGRAEGGKTRRASVSAKARWAYARRALQYLHAGRAECRKTRRAEPIKAWRAESRKARWAESSREAGWTWESNMRRA
jgi:hypothetical protein